MNSLLQKAIFIPGLLVAFLASNAQVLAEKTNGLEAMNHTALLAEARRLQVDEEPTESFNYFRPQKPVLWDPYTQDRRELIEHICQRYPNPKDSTATLTQWIELASHIGNKFPYKIRTKILEEIDKQKLLENPREQQLSAVVVLQALWNLGKHDQAALLADAWFNNSDKINAIPKGELGQWCELARYVECRGSNLDKKLIQRISNEFITSDSSIRSLEPSVWRSIAQGLCDNLTRTQREKWCSALDNAYRGERIDGRTENDLLEAMSALSERLTLEYVDKKISKKTEWQAWEPGQLARLSHFIGAPDFSYRRCTPCSRALREKIGQHVLTKYLVTDTTAQAVSPYDWAYLARSLNNVIVKPEDRKKWSDILESAFKSKPMNGGEFLAIEGTMETIDPARAYQFVAGWLTENNAWKSWSPDELADLAEWSNEDSRRESEPIKQMREMVLAHVLATYIEDSENTSSMTGYAWKKLTKSLYRYLPLSKARVWSLVLQKTFDEQGRNPDGFCEFVEAIGQLSGLDSASYLKNWMKRHDICKLWNLEEVANLGIWASDGKHPDIRLEYTITAIIAKHVILNVLSSEDILFSVESETRERFVRAGIGVRLLEETKKLYPGTYKLVFQKWGEMFSRYFSSKIMHGEQFSSSLEILKAFSPEHAAMFAANWMNKNNTWKSWSPQVKQKIIHGCQGSQVETKDGISAARLISEHLTSQYIRNEKNIDNIPIYHWRYYVEKLARWLTEEERKQWSINFQNYFSKDNISPRDIVLIAEIISLLDNTNEQEKDDTAGLVFVQSWLQRNEKNWKSWFPDDFVELCGYLRGTNEIKKEEDKKENEITKSEEIRKALAHYLIQTYGKDSETTRSLSYSSWDSLVGYFGDVLSESEKEEWQKKLCLAFQSSEMIGEDFGNALSAIQSLTSKRDPNNWWRVTNTKPDVIVGFASEYLEKTQAWKGWAPDAYIRILGWSKDENFKDQALTKDIRAKLISAIDQRFLADNNSALLVDGVELSRMVQYCAEDLSPEMKQKWCTTIYDAFLTSDVRGLTAKEIIETLETLGEGKGLLFVKELTGRNTWNTWHPSDLVTITDWAVDQNRYTLPLCKEVRTIIAKHISEQCLTSEPTAEKFSRGFWMNLARNLHNELSSQERLRVAARLCEGFIDGTEEASGLSDADFNTLRNRLDILGGGCLGDILDIDRKHYGLYGDVMGYTRPVSHLQDDIAWLRFIWNFACIPPEKQDHYLEIWQSQLSGDSIVPWEILVKHMNALGEIIAGDTRSTVKPSQITLVLYSHEGDIHKAEMLWERYLKEIEHESVGDAGEIDIAEENWNSNLRHTLTKLASVSNTSEGETVWQAGLKSLPQLDRPRMHFQTLTAIDRCLAALDNNEPNLQHKILDDLEHLVPNANSIQELQIRKCELFAKEKDWGNAQNAGSNAFAFSFVTPDSPVKVVDRIKTILKKAGMDTNKADAFESQCQESEVIKALSFMMLSNDTHECWWRRMSRWGIEELRNGNSVWTAIFWKTGIRIANSMDNPLCIVDDIISRSAFEDSKIDIATPLSQAAKEFDNKDTQIHVLRICGKMHYKNKRYSHCAKVLCSVRLLGGENDISDSSLDFMEAMSQIQLNNFTEAMKLLQGLGKNSPVAEIRARAMFLVGWIYLKQNDTTKAKEALQAAIQAEPNGPHAMKAVQLVSKLQ